MGEENNNGGVKYKSLFLRFVSQFFIYLFLFIIAIAINIGIIIALFYLPWNPQESSGVDGLGDNDPRIILKIIPAIATFISILISIILVRVGKKIKKIPDVSQRKKFLSYVIIRFGYIFVTWSFFSFVVIFLLEQARQNENLVG